MFTYKNLVDCPKMSFSYQCNITLKLLIDILCNETTSKQASIFQCQVIENFYKNEFAGIKFNALSAKCLSVNFVL